MLRIEYRKTLRHSNKFKNILVDWTQREDWGVVVFKRFNSSSVHITLCYNGGGC